MKIRAIWFAGAFLSALVALVCAPTPSLAGNSSGAAPRQSTGDNTLEIAPEHSPQAPSPATAARAPNAQSNPGAESAGFGSSLLSSGSTARPVRRPYLGIAVRYVAVPHLGHDQHGLEVVSVDPGSPAEKAGLRGSTGATAAGSVGKGASEILGPLGSLTMPLLRKTGALGEGGDVIVAVDDERVRSRDDLANRLAQLKPGDTLYLTVIRPLGGAGHKTVKVAVTLGGAGRYVTAGPGGAPWTY